MRTLALFSVYVITYISYLSAAHHFFASSKSSFWGRYLLIYPVELWIVLCGCIKQFRESVHTRQRE